MPAEPTLFVVEPPTATADLIDRLARGLSAVIEPAREERRTYLDTFDRLVRDAGWILDATVSPRGGVTVTLRVPGEGPAQPSVPAPKTPVFAADLPSGRLGDIVRKAVDVRALQPVAVARVVVHPLTVRNVDDKAVARLVIEEVTGQHKRVGRWVRLLPVRGYDKASELVRDELAAAGIKPASAERDVLDALSRAGLTAAEAPPSLISVHADQTAAAAVVSVLRALLEVIEANVQGTVDDVDPEYLHDYRVAVRRSRSALKQAHDVLPADLLACFKPELSWLQEVTGPARDLDVMDLWLAEEDKAEHAGDLKPVRDLVVRRRREAHQAMVDDITSDRAKALLADWRSTLDHLAESADAPAGAEAGEWDPWPEGAARPIVAVVEDEIVKREKAVHKRGGKIDDDSPAEDLHDLRKRGKELRYLFELFGSALPAKRVASFVKELKGLQDVLGTFQDTAVQAEELRDLEAQLEDEGAPPEALEAVEALVARTLERQDEARRGFGERYQRFAATRW